MLSFAQWLGQIREWVRRGERDKVKISGRKRRQALEERRNTERARR